MVVKCNTPYRKSQTEQLDNKKTKSNTLYELLKDDIPSSCFVQLMEEKRYNPRR
ncbi:hypothetical protein DPMN_081060 [Dreissena polymorpha]|uniref:Uncharacterized protein n=1 Tax=Dreissena polymorpha TaxID=45954 RepID=A0A9D4B8W0_DREPO|nr:hypothetical protein DPMN_081021 [Dreissena polymorpha]KAH3693621.1 hypothetical protein DPMN_081060 [Dreissena polymorpha]